MSFHSISFSLQFQYSSLSLLTSFLTFPIYAPGTTRLNLQAILSCQIFAVVSIHVAFCCKIWLCHMDDRNYWINATTALDKNANGDLLSLNS